MEGSNRYYLVNMGLNKIERKLIDLGDDSFTRVGKQLMCRLSDIIYINTARKELNLLDRGANGFGEVIRLKASTNSLRKVKKIIEGRPMVTSEVTEEEADELD